MSDCYRIVRLEASNIKRLKAVEVTPEGNLVVVGGRNAQGKSSLLDAIEMALAGARSIPGKPVRDGEKAGEVTLDLGDLIVKRHIPADGGQSTLTVTTPGGAVHRAPQSLLDKLIGALTFDPLAFVGMKPAEQRRLLANVLGVDVTLYESERAGIMEDRKMANRDKKRLEAHFKSLPEVADAPKEKVSLGKLLEDRRALEALHDEYKKRALAVKAAQAEAASAKDDVDRARALWQKAQRAEEAKTSAALELSRDFESSVQPQPLAELDEKISQVETINAAVDAANARKDARAEWTKYNMLSEGYTEALKVLDDDFRQKVADADIPVKGLGITDGVTYKGVPFDQASSAEQLRVSVALAIAQNPKLRIMLIRDGSLLDGENFQLLSDIAKEHDIQVWIEVVGEDGQVVIEDGAVAE